jgi:hypothetical protein
MLNMVKSIDSEESQNKWISFLESIQKATNKLFETGCDLPYYRGHFERSWKLIPEIYRSDYLKYPNKMDLESTLSTDFECLCGQLYDKELNDWEMAFEMRHAGLPTRLLDWSENFATALHFALLPPPNNESISEIKPCIWILDPFKLNKKSFGLTTSYVPPVSSLNFDYFIDSKAALKRLKKKVKGTIAFIPPRGHERIFAQKSVFTYHIDDIPLEKYYGSSLKKIEIPFECKEQIDLFLFLAGVNEYSLFPDLDGLGAYLRKRHLPHEV